MSEEDRLKILVMELTQILLMAESQLSNAWAMLEIIEQKRRNAA